MRGQLSVAVIRHEVGVCSASFKEGCSQAGPAQWGTQVNVGTLGSRTKFPSPPPPAQPKSWNCVIWWCMWSQMGSKSEEESTAWVIRSPAQGLSFLFLSQGTCASCSQLVLSGGENTSCVNWLLISTAAASTRGHLKLRVNTFVGYY